MGNWWGGVSEKGRTLVATTSFLRHTPSLALERRAVRLPQTCSPFSTALLSEAVVATMTAVQQSARWHRPIVACPILLYRWLHALSFPRRLCSMRHFSSAAFHRSLAHVCSRQVRLASAPDKPPTCCPLCSPRGLHLSSARFLQW